MRYIYKEYNRYNMRTLIEEYNDSDYCWFTKNDYYSYSPFIYRESNQYRDDYVVIFLENSPIGTYKIITRNGATTYGHAGSRLRNIIVSYDESKQFDSITEKYCHHWEDLL